MRGRTNITQRALPYVNGDVITAEVETGNTISVGDFVEYKTLSAISDAGFLSNNEDYCNHTLFLTDYILVINFSNLSGTVLSLWNKNTKTKVNSISFSGSNKGCFTVTNNNKIILWFNSTSSEDVLTVKTLEYSNNDFVVLDTKVYSIANDLWISSAGSGKTGGCITVIDNSHFILLTGSSTQAIVAVIEFNDSTGVIGSVLTKTSIPSTNLYSLKYCESINPADKRALVSFVQSNTIKAVFIKFDSNYEATISSIDSVSTISYYSFAKLSSKSLLAFHSISKESSGAWTYPNKVDVFTYDETNDIIQKYAVNLEQRSFGGDVKAALVKNGVAYLSMPGYSQSGSTSLTGKGSFIGRVEFDEENKDIIVSNFVGVQNDVAVNNPMYIIQIAFENSNQMIGYNMVNDNSKTAINNKMISLSYSPGDNELDAGVDTDYVKSYNGGKSIGFAKTAGVAGENIRIYVPHNS